MERIKTVGIIGAGALGVMYGKQLAKALGRKNLFFIADRNRIDAYEKKGITCNGEPCVFTFADCGEPNGQKADLILFAVKYYGLPAAVKAVQPFVTEKTTFMSVMNGIESEAWIEQAYGKEHLLYCVVHGMDALKNGMNISYKNKGTVVFGTGENRESSDVKAVKALFDEAGIHYEVPEDIKKRMWSKFMLNVGVNQVSAVWDLPYGGMQKPGKPRDMIVAAMKEVQTLAAKEGVSLTDEDIQKWLEILDTLDPESMPSMRQDTKAGRPTEVEIFSGTVRRLGAKYGVSTPVNDYLYCEIKKMADKS